MEGYRVENIVYDDPALTQIQHTFLITTVGSKESYREVLDDTRPTKYIHIVYNEGYKSGKKDAWVRTTFQDLWHANLFIFSLAKDMDEPILVLEDDVKFYPRFRNKAHEVERFILSQPDIRMYTFGSMAYATSRKINGHLRLWHWTGTHAVVFTKQCRTYLQTTYSTVTINHASLITNDSKLPTYTSVQPMAYQKHFLTENALQILKSRGVPSLVTHQLIPLYFGLVDCTKDGSFVYECAHLTRGYVNIICSLILWCTLLIVKRRLRGYLLTAAVLLVVRLCERDTSYVYDIPTHSRLYCINHLPARKGLVSHLWVNFHEWKVIFRFARDTFRKTGNPTAIIAGKAIVRLGLLPILRCMGKTCASPYVHLIYGDERVRQSVDFLKAGNNVIIFGCLGNSNDFGGTGLYHMSVLSNLPVTLLHMQQLNRYKYSLKYVAPYRIRRNETPQQYIERMHRVYASLDPSVIYKPHFKHVY